jgi:hypothetical protein
MPSDRLVRFRQYMAAFEGAADPAKSIEHSPERFSNSKFKDYACHPPANEIAG